MRKIGVELVLEQLPQDEVARWAMKMASKLYTSVRMWKMSLKQRGFLTQEWKNDFSRLDLMGGCLPMVQECWFLRLTNFLSTELNHKSATMLRVFKLGCNRPHAGTIVKRIMPSSQKHGGPDDL